MPSCRYQHGRWTFQHHYNHLSHGQSSCAAEDYSSCCNCDCSHSLNSETLMLQHFSVFNTSIICMSMDLAVKSELTCRSFTWTYSSWWNTWTKHWLNRSSAAAEALMLWLEVWVIAVEFNRSHPHAVGSKFPRKFRRNSATCTRLGRPAIIFSELCLYITRFAVTFRPAGLSRDPHGIGWNSLVPTLRAPPWGSGDETRVKRQPHFFEQRVRSDFSSKRFFTWTSVW